MDLRQKEPKMLQVPEQINGPAAKSGKNALGQWTKWLDFVRPLLTRYGLCGPDIRKRPRTGRIFFTFRLLLAEHIRPVAMYSL